MNIDERDIEKGALPAILPGFHPNSISYLSELNDYRMYAEVWTNNRSKAEEKRSEIGHMGYLKTLEFGEQKKKRKSDKVRFDNFIVADSLNYKTTRNIYGESKAYIQIGRIQTNTIFNDIIKAKVNAKDQTLLRSDSDFHSKRYLPKILKLDLEQLGLHKDKKTSKHYFDISTNVETISNQNQQMLLTRILGREDVFEKLQLLYKVGRKSIRCLFENPGYVTKNIGTSDAIPRLCVAWPFIDTLVFDFAGTPEEYGEACLLGTLINAKSDQTESEGHFDRPQIDNFA